MKTIAKKVEKNNKRTILRHYVLLFSIMLLSTISVIGQNNANGNVSSTAKDDSNTETEIRKEAEHQEKMGYVYMALGFGLIMGIAWFMVAGKKKKQESEPNGHHPITRHTHHHGIDNKKYGTNRARG
jgi:hypothetical protein